jgi:hypothetical protein
LQTAQNTATFTNITLIWHKLQLHYKSRSHSTSIFWMCSVLMSVVSSSGQYGENSNSPYFYAIISKTNFIWARLRFKPSIRDERLAINRPSHDTAATITDNKILTFQNPAITLRTARFNIQKFYRVLTLGTCILYDLTTNSDFCLTQT